MRIILREDRENLGKAGDVVSVRPGYGRNYLLPAGLAVPATEKDEARLQHEKRVIASRVAKLAKEMQSEADRLSQVSVTLSRAVGEEDKLYGSVTNRDVAEALNLFVLGGQVRDRVAHEVGELERPGHPGGREVADRHADVVRARLRLQLRDHGRR